MPPQPKSHKKFKARLGTDPGNSKIQGSMLDHPSLRQNSPGIITITITIQTRILSKIFYNGEKNHLQKTFVPNIPGQLHCYFPSPRHSAQTSSLDQPTSTAGCIPDRQVRPSGNTRNATSSGHPSLWHFVTQCHSKCCCLARARLQQLQQLLLSRHYHGGL